MAATSYFVVIPTPIPASLRTPMNDHHFSYPRVVPLQGATISGHAVHPPAPIASLQATRLVQAPPRPSAPGAPAPKVTSLAA